jgi:hypothetical protein
MGPMLFQRRRHFFRTSFFQDLDMRHYIALKYGVFEARVAEVKTDGDHEKSKVKIQ